MRIEEYIMRIGKVGTTGIVTYKPSTGREYTAYSCYRKRNRVFRQLVKKSGRALTRKLKGEAEVYEVCWDGILPLPEDFINEFVEGCISYEKRVTKGLETDEDITIMYWVVPNGQDDEISREQIIEVITEFDTAQAVKQGIEDTKKPFIDKGTFQK